MALHRLQRMNWFLHQCGTFKKTKRCTERYQFMSYSHYPDPPSCLLCDTQGKAHANMFYSIFSLLALKISFAFLVWKCLSYISALFDLPCVLHPFLLSSMGEKAAIIKWVTPNVQSKAVLTHWIFHDYYTLKSTSHCFFRCRTEQVPITPFHTKNPGFLTRDNTRSDLGSDPLHASVQPGSALFTLNPSYLTPVAQKDTDWCFILCQPPRSTNRRVSALPV